MAKNTNNFPLKLIKVEQLTDDQTDAVEKPTENAEYLKEFVGTNNSNQLLVVRKIDVTDRPHSCPQCGMNFKRGDHLRRHINSTHNEINFSCPICNKHFKQEKVLTAHVKAKHKDINKFVCHECVAVFTSLNIYIKHYIDHLVSESRVFKCSKCPSKFKRMDHVRRHMRTKHMQEFVTCKVCNAEYKRNDYLYKHMKEKHGA